jgi:HSP20 family protein
VAGLRRGSGTDAAWHRLLALRQEFDRLFEEITSSLPAFPFARRGLEIEPLRKRQSLLWASLPAVDMVERSKEFQLTAELPGLDEKDIEVRVNDDLLTIKGEKRSERTEKLRTGTYLAERRYGAFQRSFRLPTSVVSDRIEARFHKGVLTVRLPKATADKKKSERRIVVRRGPALGA